MGLFKKGQKAYSIVNLKCPRCHEGDMFYTGSFSFKRSFDMKERCDVCNEDLFPEPGFYYGAMFISYIFTAWFCIFFVMFFHWVLGWSTMASFALLLAVVALCFVYFFRLARSIWINLNVKYDPDAAANPVPDKGASSSTQYGK
jgi:uncharacterized protein (DUF983 family)